jgi:hypothetical protein
MSWLTSRKSEDQPSPTQRGSLRLQEVDCPAGLARCVEGAVEIAQVFRHPEPCTGQAEQCACPWQVVGRCPGACVSDGVSLPLTAARAVRQLCAPGPADPAAGQPPPLGSPPPVACGDEPYRCTGSKVVACPAARIVASCTTGCSEEGQTLDDPVVDDPAAVYLLCSR